MGDVPITHVASSAFQRFSNAQMNCLHAMTSPADDMMMVRFATVEFIAKGAITKITTTDDLELLESSQTSIHGHQITSTFRHSPMDFIRGKRPVLTRQNFQNGTSRAGDALPPFPEHAERRRERVFRRLMPLSH
jgi:hypothetical protein